MAAPLPPRCDETGAWQALQRHFVASGRTFDLRRAFVDDSARVDAFSIQAPHVFADLSKNLLDAEGERLLLQLARDCRVEAQRDAMFAGEAINATEGRQVMHWLLRAPRDEKVAPGIAGELAQVRQTLDAMLDFAEAVRADRQITDVVNIGIGGSDLGPQMAVRALDEFVLPGKRFHFVSNIDGHELDRVLRGLQAEHTLFLIASKTFTTLETMTNARSARLWFTQQGGTAVARHFAALTTNVKAAAEFGIDRTFGFWDWVGGRYSLWSAIGLPVAIAIGAARFRELLAGAHAMDRHFRSEPPGRNLPLRLALLDLWYRDFHGFASRSVAPYHSALARLPAYLQQLEMESNGKRVDRQGRELSYGTSPVVWGEPGTNGQHAYFQMLHQGTDVVPVEFIAVKTPAHELADHHPQLLANVLAQAAALMQGKDDPGGHKHFPGNRPSTMLLLDRLDPASFGALIALYEHRVFCAGALWGINSFDQWGVELGKVLAKDIAQRLASGDTAGLDRSTAALLTRLRA
ncbi:glucose-6-phosphate isomerase [Ramlibacter sp.]|uniref:glucose-6-phosphate isomerase n=1 Tax=Ramlibacter sp. TaxID=1917967 RepID=UPI002D360230|nr:glucose-6-phosphate isomerase [Ramlibacter sp.]HYD76790.1 glucose-6-phosphate isomerase [Ramlibacter sp.]